MEHDQKRNGIACVDWDGDQGPQAAGWPSLEMEWLAGNFTGANPSSVEEANVEPRHYALGECGRTGRQRYQARWILGLKGLQENAGEHQRAAGQAAEAAWG
jgi:hypothetical protein